MSYKEVKSQIQQQLVIAEMMSNAVDKLRNVGEQTLTPQRAEIRIEALKNQWSRFSSNSDNITQNIT